MEIDRKWHPNFTKYAEALASNAAYRGLLIDRNREGQLNWVVAGKSEKGQKRLEWWNGVLEKLGIPIKSGNYAIAARLIHPTKIHVCQCCGKELSIYYVYPKKALLTAINERYGRNLAQTDEDIFAIIDRFCRRKPDIDFFSEKFGLNGISSRTELESAIKSMSRECKGPLSPGVMSNCPDRFDGFHSDGLCCRSRTDKGRHADNLKTYTQDRRAYEEWADGDYNLANRIMGEYHKLAPMECPECGRIEKLTADHIGPISLGFCHDIHFAAMCRQCNSSKNNRFSYNDVQKLIGFEQNGDRVISWHSAHLWEALKPRIKDDESAKKASAVLAANHQNVLKLLSELHKAGCDEYLMRFLHPEISLNDYRFENFDPCHPENTTIMKTECDSKNKRKNQERYVRIAFETLEAFGEKDNRRNRLVVDQVSEEIGGIVSAIMNGRIREADRLLNQAIRTIGSLVLSQEWPE